MKTAAIRLFLFGIVLSLMHPVVRADAADAVVIGVATSLTTIEGAESMRAAALAVEEINRKGGIRLNHRRIPLRLASIDLQDADDNNRKSDSLRKLEQFIQVEKLHAIVVGPFRSEVLLPAMDIIARHRVPLLETIAMTPAIESMILRDSRYRYVFRTGLNTKYLADALIQIMKYLNTRFGLYPGVYPDPGYRLGAFNGRHHDQTLLRQNGLAGTGRGSLCLRRIGFFFVSGKSQGKRRPGDPADFRYAPKRQIGPAVERNGNSRHAVRFYFPHDRTRGLEGI